MMQANRQTKNYPRIVLSLSAIQAYAKGSAPYIGVPIVEDGTRRAAVFTRKILLAAISAPVIAAHYDVEAHTLTVNGGPRACYTLKDLAANGMPYQIRNKLERWAATKRKNVSVRRMPAHLKKDAKRRQAISKLEKQLSKIYVHAPVNPVCAQPREESAYANDSLAEYMRQRPMRRALGRIYGRYNAHLFKPRGRFPWASVTADIVAAGMRLDPYNAWSKIRTRQAHRGMDIPAYLKSLPQFVGLARKPWDCEPLDFAKRREQYTENLKSYFTSKQESDGLKEQIANLKRATETPLALEQAAS